MTHMDKHEGIADPQFLQALTEMPNIASELPDDTLGSMSNDVMRGIEADEDSLEDRRQTIKDALRLVRQIKEEKSWPWPGAASAKYPLIYNAAIQFAARAYPEIVKGSDVVKGQVMGAVTPEKEDRAERIAKHMSWQLLVQMTEWDEETDRLLHMLPITGVVWRKTWFDPVKGRNVSEVLTEEECFCHYKTRSLETAQRVTHRYWLYDREIWEHTQAGTFIEFERGRSSDSMETGEEDAPHEFLECHTYWDLDKDGYSEPYIITIHAETRKVVRVVARFDPDGVEFGVDQNGQPRLIRIKPVLYFTKYSFIPAPDGSFYDVGFGTLLCAHNELLNTVLNQLLDAGTLSNMGGGFLAKGVRMKGGSVQFAPGEWKPVDTAAQDLRQGIVPLPIREPSMVLFQLLGFLVDSGKEMSAVSDVLAGQSPGSNTPATTTLAVIEQGLKVFSAIYKRIYRALTDELQRLRRMNRLYLQDEEYFAVLDQPGVVARQDYLSEDYDVRPVADPSLSTDVQRLARAEALLQFANDPLCNPYEIRKRYMEALKIDNIDAVLPEPKPAPPGPDPAMVEKVFALEMAKARQDAEIEKIYAEIGEVKARAMKYVAEAEAVEQGKQIDAYHAHVESMSQNPGGKASGNTGRMAGVEGQPNNADRVPVTGS